MNAKLLVTKLGKLLGKKVNTPATGQYPGGVATVHQVAPEEKAPEILLLDRLGVIQFHEHWRN
jgi:hypothetical protein